MGALGIPSLRDKESLIPWVLPVEVRNLLNSNPIPCLPYSRLKKISDIQLFGQLDEKPALKEEVLL